MAAAAAQPPEAAAEPPAVAEPAAAEAAETSVEFATVLHPYEKIGFGATMCIFLMKT